jgi:hypothetical protein
MVEIGFLEDVILVQTGKIKELFGTYSKMRKV